MQSERTFDTFDVAWIVEKLDLNKSVFRSYLEGLKKDECLWKPEPKRWCLLEIICHLGDEEREDFRPRVERALKGTQPDRIDPVAWVAERRYIEQDYERKLNEWIVARATSVEWLRNLDGVDWNSGFDHASFGKMTAKFMLANWLAHDYLHLKQISRLKYNYLKVKSGEDLTYAGNW